MCKCECKKIFFCILLIAGFANICDDFTYAIYAIRAIYAILSICATQICAILSICAIRATQICAILSIYAIRATYAIREISRHRERMPRMPPQPDHYHLRLHPMARHMDSRSHLRALQQTQYQVANYRLSYAQQPFRISCIFP
jgi:hypothetical protein